VKDIPFLRDIEDEVHYAQQLELAWFKMGKSLKGVLEDFPLIPDCGVEDLAPYWMALADTYGELATLRNAIFLVCKDMAERRKRLADRSVGLADRKVDE